MPLVPRPFAPGLLRLAGRAVLFACLVAAARAQTAPRLVNLTDVAPLVLTQDLQTCATSRCVPAGMPAPPTAVAGGVAHDPIARGTWITDGTRAARIDVSNRCGYQCSPAPLPGLTPGQPVTGLAFDLAQQELLAVDAANVLHRYAVQGCGLSPVGTCTLDTGPGETVTGLAVDSAAGRLFYAASNGSAPGGTVRVAMLADPCTAVCQFSVTGCGGATLGPVTGLALDVCAARLWLTDGSRTVGGVVSFAGGSCSFVEDRCCVSSFGETFVGMAIAPKREVSSGTSCVSSGCGNCRSLEHVLVGDPVIGNPAFGLALDNAPAGSSAFAMLNAGACVAQGVPVPPLCGEFLVPLGPLPLFVIGPLATGGGAGCGGSAVLPVPVPPLPALCGAVLSSQFFGLCTSGPTTGTYVSNCVTWILGSA